MSLEIMSTFSYRTAYRIHRKHIVLQAYLVAWACQQSIDYFITSNVCSDYTHYYCVLMLFNFKTVWTNQMALVSSRREVICNSSVQKSFLLSGRARTYVGTWTPWPVKMGPIGCPETSINYQHTLLNIPDKRGPQMHQEGSLKSRKTLGPSQYNELLWNNRLTKYLFAVIYSVLWTTYSPNTTANPSMYFSSQYMI
jgi:hypothetical protein